MTSPMQKWRATVDDTAQTGEARFPLREDGIVVSPRRIKGALALLAGCCGLLVPVAVAAEWNGIKVADPAPKVSVTPIAPSSRAAAVPAPEGTTVQAVWDAFVGGLRCGQMRAAYAQLAPSSREEINYRDFCASWHPLSLKYEEVLSPPGFSEFRISGDLATLRLGLRQSPRGTAVVGADPVPVYGAKGMFLQAVLIREDGRWWVLDGQNIDNAVAEASARNALTRLVRDNGPVREALQNGGTLTLADLRRLMPRFFEETATGEFLRNYRLEVDALRDCVVRAVPLREGLRGYRLGLDGILAVLPKQAPAKPAIVAAPVKPAAQSLAKSGAASGQKETAAVPPAVENKPAGGFFKAPNGVELPPLPPAFGDPDQAPASIKAAARVPSAASGISAAPASVFSAPPAPVAPIDAATVLPSSVETVRGSSAGQEVVVQPTSRQPISRPASRMATLPAAPAGQPAPVRKETTPVRQPTAGDDFALPEFEDEQPKRKAPTTTAIPAATDQNLLMTAPAGKVPHAEGIRNLNEFDVPPIQDSVVMPAEVSLPALEEPASPTAQPRPAAKSGKTPVPPADADSRELKGLLDSLIDGGGKNGK